MEPQSSSAASAGRTIRFGVLGTGRITRRLVADLQQTDGVQVVAIASRDGARARWYADQFGIPQACHGYEQLLASDSVDAVYIALPPALHVQWVVAAADAGKHVLCEKPLARFADEAEKVRATCEARNVRWIDATAWLHHPRTTSMRQELDAGRLGTVRHISTAVSFFQPFQSEDHRLVEDLGGGCLLDLGWYAFGAAVWAAGQRTPGRVTAVGNRQGGVWQRVSAICEFHSGVTASVHCAYDIATRKWMEVAGDAASIVCDDFTRPWPDKTARFWVHDRTGSARAESAEGHQEQRMITALVEEINGRTELSSARRQAMATQHTLQAAECSLREERAVTLEHGDS